MDTTSTSISDKCIMRPYFEQKIREKYSFTEAEKDVFRPKTLDDPRQQIPKIGYGGLIASQALAAGDITVPNTSKAHALNTYFFHPIDTTKEVLMSVSRLRDSSSFNTRIIEVNQNNRLAFMAIVSYHSGKEHGAIHQSEMPKVPDPGEFQDFGYELSQALQKYDKGQLALSRPIVQRLRDYDVKAHTHPNSVFEMRAIDIDRFLGRKITEPTLKDYFWMKTRQPLSDDEKLHRLLLAYNIDTFPPDSALRPHFGKGFEPSFIGSITYNVRFHKEFRADNWLLLEIENEISVNSRVFSRGRVWQKGQIVASFDSETLIRTKGPPSNL